MTVKQTRSYAMLAIAIVLAALIIGSSAYLISYATGRTTTLISSSIVTATITTATTVTFSAETTVTTTGTCALDGPSFGLFVQVTHGGQPVAGANLTVSNECMSNQPTILGSDAYTTNSSGWVGPLCRGDNGICIVNVSAFGYDYPLSIPLYQGGICDVHFDPLSGDVTVTDCTF